MRGFINFLDRNLKIIHPKLFIIVEIIKPTRPSARMPMAETFEISLNSSADGFFNILQTLSDWE